MVVNDPLVAGFWGAVLGAASIGCIFLAVKLWKLPTETPLGWSVYPRLMVIFAAMPIGCTPVVVLRAMLASGSLRAGWVAGDCLGLAIGIGWWWHRRRMTGGTTKG